MLAHDALAAGQQHQRPQGEGQGQAQDDLTQHQQFVGILAAREDQQAHSGGARNQAGHQCAPAVRPVAADLEALGQDASGQHARDRGALAGGIERHGEDDGGADTERLADHGMGIVQAGPDQPRPGQRGRRHDHDRRGGSALARSASDPECR
ncbi:hypothetical protein G6F65_021408 [Rhizopus arrhizus]|nr:hypothetical protein G6F65_021408 [Rhizopus arrhizus]